MLAAAAALLTIIFATGAVLALRGGGLRYPDEHEYLQLGATLAEHGSLLDERGRPTAFRPPAFPFMLALALRAGASTLELELLNVMVLVAAAGLLGVFLLRRAGPEAAVAGVALVVCYPVLAYAASTLYPQTVAGLLLVLFVHLLFVDRPSSWRAAGAGVTFAVLVLTVPTFLSLLPLVMLLIWYQQRQPRVTLRVAGVFALLAVLSLLPWTVRNWTVFGELVPVSTNSGLVLLRGNAPGAGADTGVNVDISTHLAAARSMSEVESDAYYRRTALEYIREDKLGYLALYARKLANHFNFSNELFSSQETTSLRSVLMALTYYPLLGLALLRFVLARRFRPQRWEVVVGVLYLGFALISALFFTRIRFRLPLDLLLISVVASFLITLWWRWRGQRSGSASTPVASVEQQVVGSRPTTS